MVRQDLPNETMGVDHGLQSNGGAILHYWSIGGTFGESPGPEYFALGFGSMSSGDLVLYNAAMPRRTWLLLEWAIHRDATPTGARAEIRVTDLEGGRVWTGADWRNSYGVGSRSLADYPITITDAANLGTYMFGVSGSGLRGSSVQVAAFCVRLDSWCGPYVAGVG
jgi:hypothetical protein